MALNQQQLEKQGIYDGKGTLASLAADLQEIGTMADAAVALRKKRSKTGGLMMVGGLICALVGIAFAPLMVLGILTIVAGFFWMIYSYFAASKLVSHRGRLEIAQRRIAMIQEDASPKAPFSLQLSITTKPTQLSNEAWHGRKNGKQQFFEEAWLTLEGPLLDGTLVTDEIKDLTRKRTFSNPRGKTKTKTKLTHLVNVRFCYPNELYGDARPAEHALHGEVRVAPPAMLRSVRVTEKAIAMKALAMAEKDILPTVGMLSVGGYRILNLARRMAAGQRGNAKQ